MMKVNVNTTPTLTIKVETFRSDKKYFEQPKPTLTIWHRLKFHNKYLSYLLFVSFYTTV